MNLVLAVWKKNLKWILLAGLLVGAALALEKTLYTDTVVKSDRFYVEQEISVTYAHPETVGDIKDYQTLFHSFVVLSRFMEETKNDFDYSQWDEAFPTMTKEKQLEWMQNHLSVTNMGNRSCVYSFNLPANIRKNDSYVEEYGKEFLNRYIAFTQKELQQMGMDSTYQKQESFVLKPEIIQVNNKSRALKYGAAGFVLGALLSMLVLGVKAYGKGISNR